jgi:hypothetical protein
MARATDDYSSSELSDELGGGDGRGEPAVLGSLKTTLRWDAADKALRVGIKQSAETMRGLEGTYKARACLRRRPRLLAPPPPVLAACRSACTAAAAAGRKKGYPARGAAQRRRLPLERRQHAAALRPTPNNDDRPPLHSTGDAGHAQRRLPLLRPPGQALLHHQALPE